MARDGRKPAPTALKLLKGTQPCRIPKGEPLPSEAEFAPPSWLDGHEVALAEWAKLAPDLIRTRVGQSWDGEAFGEWCLAVERVAEASRHVLDEGAVIDQHVFGRDGAVTGTRKMRNPWALELKDALAITASRGAQFGLTPSDRSRLSVGEVEHDDSKSPERLMS